MKSKLVNKKSGKAIVEFEGEKAIFHNKYLEHEMRELGIPIPHGLRGVYYGKASLRLGEEGFQKAFREVYYLTTMDPALFEWQDGLPTKN